MNWTRLSDWCLSAGPYTVTKASVGGEFKYRAWYGKTPLGETTTSAAAAKAVCVAHSEKEGK